MDIYKNKKTSEVICPYCGCNESYIYFTIDNKKRVDDEWGRCVSCREITYENSFVYEGENVKVIPHQIRKRADKYIPPKPTVKCPYCGSTSTKKISTLSRMGSFATFGFAGKKVGKQWHCNNCKSDF